MLIGFLHRGGLEQWSYAIMADIAAQGAEVMRFTCEDVDFEKRQVWGEVWQDSQWVKRRFRYPDAVRNFEFRDETKDVILEHLPYSLGRHLRKNEQLDLLAKIPNVASFIPVTLDLDDQMDIFTLVQKWGGVILKPARGRLGQGIVFIRRTGQQYELEEDGQRKPLDQDALQNYLRGFAERTGRSYVVQQFAATTGPQNRYFNVRIIIQKSGDGDWHPCDFPLSLLAQPGSVVANREAGATNVSLKSMLQYRFTDKADQVLEAIFSAAVLIARALDDALAQQADELALDMAVDDKGAPWLHETNWRGGFWMLEEDVGLYRYGGANVVRLARRHQFGGDIDAAQAALHIARNRNKNCRHAPGSNLLASRLGIDIPLRSEVTVTNITSLILAGVDWFCVSDSSSFGAAQQAVGRALDVLLEQMPERPLPKLVSMSGFCQHDPFDTRSPQRWITQELVAKGIITDAEASLGLSMSPDFLKRAITKNCQDLGVSSLDVFLLQGIEYRIDHDANWHAAWRLACQELSRSQTAGDCLEWGVCLSYQWLMAHRDNLYELLSVDASNPVRAMLVEVRPDEPVVDIAYLCSIATQFALKLMIKVLPLAPCIKPWHASHRLVPLKMVQHLVGECVNREILIFCPVANAVELDDFLVLNQNFSGEDSPMLTNDVATSSPSENLVTRALQAFAQFDARQLFRFFVDGRFHKKYQGWTGYEANEAGSVQGILDAYQLMIENFDLSKGLTSRYIRDLHIACMGGVSTKNKKSTPGEMRSLESGINLYNGKSTLASVQELLEQRRGDGNSIFHHPDYQKPAEAFTAQEILQIIKKEGRVRYRAWYPNLTQEQQQQLTQGRTLSEFYAVKHFVQKCFAERTDHIVDVFNQEVAAAQTPHEHLIAISRVVRDLELLHPFPDGNGRTFVAVLMNHLLLAKGFLPAILWDPNIDAELSVIEFADEIRLGIKNTETLLRDPTATLYDYAITQAKPDEIKVFQGMAQAFIASLHGLAYRTEAEPTEDDHNQAFIYLTPSRLVASTGGQWLPTNQHTMSLRFDRISTGNEPGHHQLLFCRNLATWREAGKDPLLELQREINDGVIAIVIDDNELALKLNLPVLLVADVDQALYDAGVAARKAITCRRVAVVGTEGAETVRSLLTQAGRQQLRVQVDERGECKTPLVMASLANLRRTDQLQIIEVAMGARVNVARHRLRAIEPDYCVFTSTDNVDGIAPETYADVLKTFAACVDGLQPGGLCILNADSVSAVKLTEEIKARGVVSIQTFGRQTDNDACMLGAIFDTHTARWTVTANILGKSLTYTIRGKASPLWSVAVLLLMENMGCDIQTASRSFENF